MFNKIQNRSEQIGKNQAIDDGHGNSDDFGDSVLEIGAPEHQEKEAYAGSYDQKGRDAPIEIFFVPAEFHNCMVSFCLSIVGRNPDTGVHDIYYITPALKN